MSKPLNKGLCSWIPGQRQNVCGGGDSSRAMIPASASDLVVLQTQRKFIIRPPGWRERGESWGARIKKETQLQKTGPQHLQGMSTTPRYGSHVKFIGRDHLYGRPIEKHLTIVSDGRHTTRRLKTHVGPGHVYPAWPHHTRGPRTYYLFMLGNEGFERAKASNDLTRIPVFTTRACWNWKTPAAYLASNA